MILKKTIQSFLKNTCLTIIVQIILVGVVKSDSRADPQAESNRFSNDSLEKSAENMNKISSSGHYFCPDESLIKIAFRSLWEHTEIFTDVERDSIQKDWRLSSDERSEKLRQLFDKLPEAMRHQIGEYFNNLYQRIYKDYQDHATDLAIATGVVAVTAVGATSVVYGGKRALSIFTDSELAKWLGVDQLSAGVGKGMNLIASVAYSGFSSCLGCVDRQSCKDKFTRLHSTVNPAFNDEVLHGGLANYHYWQGAVAVVGLAYLMPFGEWLESKRDVVLPLLLIPLNTLANERPQLLGDSGKNFIREASKLVAYNTIASSHSESFVSETLYLFFNSLANEELTSLQRGSSLARIIGFKAAMGLVFGQCSYMMKSLIPLGVTFPFVAYSMYTKEQVPVLNVEPKAAVLGAVIAGESIAALVSGTPEYLLIPLMLVNVDNMYGNSLIWGFVLLYGPVKAGIDYLTADTPLELGAEENQ